MAKPDSNRMADAEKARQLEAEITDPRDRAENIVKQLADSPEKKAAAGDAAGAATTAGLLGIITSLMNRLDKIEARKEELKRPPVHLRCSTCGQVASICRGEHVTLMVAPSTREYWARFQGVEINGVRYCGASVVACSQADTIMAMVRRWEGRENKLFLPGGKIFGDYASLGGKAPTPAVGSTPII